MAWIARPLTAPEVERLDTPGLHAVGTVPGLCLRIPPPPSTAKSWALRLLVNGKRRELGLGGYQGVADVEPLVGAARPRKRPLSDGANLTCPLSPCPRSCVRDPRREFGPRKYAPVELR